jgi:hypothetical protein
LLLFIIKVVDNIIITAKSIATYKEQKLWSSILVIISQFLFYLLISKVIDDNSLLSIVIVAISSGIGNYIAFTLSQKFRKAAKWTIIITSSDTEDIVGLCDFLTTNHIRHIANCGYNRKWDHSIHVIVFSKSKAESKLIDSYIKHLRVSI